MAFCSVYTSIIERTRYKIKFHQRLPFFRSLLLLRLFAEQTNASKIFISIELSNVSILLLVNHIPTIFSTIFGAREKGKRFLFRWILCENLESLVTRETKVSRESREARRRLSRDRHVLQEKSAAQSRATV